MSARDWCVMRQDASGARHVVASRLTEPEARLLSVSYGARGHDQRYWQERMVTAAAGPATPR